MIQRNNLSDLHKYFFASPGTNRFLTAFFHNIPTFSFHFGRKNLPPDGDVTRLRLRLVLCYANRYNGVFHRMGAVLKKSKYLLKT